MMIKEEVVQEVQEKLEVNCEENADVSNEGESPTMVQKIETKTKP